MRDTPAKRNACIHILQRCVELHAAQQHALLPRAHRLADDAGVSLRTMTTVLQQLRRDGVLALQHGQGFVCTASQQRCGSLRDHYLREHKQHTTGGIHAPAAQTLAERLKKDIAGGTFRRASWLPSMKELQYRYHHSYVTVKKALAQCVRDGVIEHAGTRYRVAKGSSHPSSLRICLLVTGDRTGELRLGSVHGIETSLNIECVQRNIQLYIVGWYYADERLHFFSGSNALSDIPQAGDIAGYITTSFIADRGYDLLLRRLSHMKKPVAVHNCTDKYDLPSYRNESSIRVFSPSLGTTPGIHVGRHLGDLGHRHIAYISPFHRSNWSRNRLQGLREALAMYDPAATVTPIVLDNPPVINTFYQDEALSQCDYRRLQRLYHSWQKHNPAFVRRALEQLIDFAIPRRIIPTAYFKEKLHSLFSRALTQEHITAWVTANDEVGIEALHYLNAHDIGVPARISLASFDDTSDALRTHLTSYNFNSSSIAHHIMEWTLNTNSYPASLQRGTVHVKGTVVARLTTGQAHSSFHQNDRSA
jgi:DNA-binding LacI/PurR family transcriptional regulator/DNA-binding transcriptional regulator YhcF (GntR family)